MFAGVPLIAPVAASSARPSGSSGSTVKPQPLQTIVGVSGGDTGAAATSS